MRMIYVHPSVMNRIRSGNSEPFMTMYPVMPGEEVEVTDEDEAVSVVTRVRSVNKCSGLYRVELEDHATVVAYEKESRESR